MLEEIKNNTEIEEVINNEVSGESQANESLSPKDYKVMIDIIKEMEEQAKYLKETLSSTIRERYNLKEDIFDAILPYEKNQIPNLDREEIESFLADFWIDNDNSKYAYATIDELVDLMSVVKDASLSIISANREIEKIKSESTDALKEYFEYMNSDKIRKIKESRIETLKKAIENEPDSINKSKMEKMVATMEATLNFSFIFDRFNELGEKEINSIIETFFDQRKGEYMMKKYHDKITHFGYKPDVYKYFFNIEESFLSKKYSPYNNLFLFIYMRMVAYSDFNDRNDRMFVQSLTGALANLIYHKFDNVESEQFFVHVISEVIDKFSDYEDLFKSNNTTYEEHPLRKKAEEEHDKKRKESIIHMLDKLHISGYDPNASAEELQELYNKETELLIKKQLGETNDEATSFNANVYELPGSPVREIIHSCNNGTDDLLSGLAHYNGADADIDRSENVNDDGVVEITPNINKGEIKPSDNVLEDELNINEENNQSVPIITSSNEDDEDMIIPTIQKDALRL